MTFADLFYKFFAHIYNNKQTWLGGLVAALAFLQSNDKLKGLLSTDAYEWTMMIVGLAMVLFARSASGGLVSHVLPPSVPATKPPPTVPPPPPESGRASVLLVGLLALGGAALAAVPIVSCTYLGVQPAVTFEERTLAVQSGVAEAQGALEAKIDAGAITKRDAVNTDAQLDSVIEALDIAIGLRQANDPAAEGKLEAAHAILIALRKQLGV